MKRLLVVLLAAGALLPAIPAHAVPDINCSVGAFRPNPYGTAQVRGVGDIDCWTGSWRVIEVIVRIKVDSELSTPVFHTCYNTNYCSWYRILTKGAGYHCYRTWADGSVQDWDYTWYSLPAITSGPLCTS